MHLCGFRETNYADTRAKLRVEAGRLHSLVNRRSYGVGELDLASLEALRAETQGGGGLAKRLKVTVATGDVRKMHREAGNAGALFQVASQFNLLEMVSEHVTPEDGVTRYESDRTQGPACAIAAGAATIYRNFLVSVCAHLGQTKTREQGCLADAGAVSTALHTI